METMAVYKASTTNLTEDLFHQKSTWNKIEKYNRPAYEMDSVKKQKPMLILFLVYGFFFSLMFHIARYAIINV